MENSTEGYPQEYYLLYSFLLRAAELLQIVTCEVVRQIAVGHEVACRLVRPPCVVDVDIDPHPRPLLFRHTYRHLSTLRQHSTNCVGLGTILFSAAPADPLGSAP
eukprot:6420867-Pyramimonas_sp.AAC.1